MATLAQFAVRIRRRGKSIETNANALVKKVALAVDRDLVLATPVDTGRARSNWLVSVGVPVTRAIEPYSPGEKLGLGEQANATAALAQAQASILSGGDGKEIFISNNVPYILRLNRGHSAQAPSGFIEMAIGNALGLIKGARIVRTR